MKVAIVHDWLVGGGAERVVLELHRLYPDAPIYTSYCTDEWRQRLDNKVITGWLQSFGKLRKFMVLGRIWWFGRLDLADYDLVISSSGNGEAKSAKTKPGTTHICYCHSPTHFYWRLYDQYMARPGFGRLDWLARFGLRYLVGPLRHWDKTVAAQRPDYYIANSSHVAREIKQFYGREATVIFPPVDTDRFAATTATTRRGYVTAGRQTGYKHTDIIIAACNQLQVPLTVIGRGPEHDRLVRLAGPTITFRTDVTDEAMPALLAGAEAFIFAAFEDFGITPIEAMAAGTPVIAYRQGGALDYVKPGQTGTFFDEQTVESLVACLTTFHADQFSDTTLKTFAASFSSQSFRQAMRSEIKHLQRLPQSPK